MAMALNDMEALERAVMMAVASGKEPLTKHRLLLAVLSDVLVHGERTTAKFGDAFQRNKCVGEIGEFLSAISEGTEHEAMDEAADVIITVLQVGAILARSHDGFAGILAKKVRKMRTKHLGDEL